MITIISLVVKWKTYNINNILTTEIEKLNLKNFHDPMVW